MQRTYRLGATSSIEIKNYFYSEDIFCVTPLLGSTNIWWQVVGLISPGSSSGTGPNLSLAYSFDKITWNSFIVSRGTEVTTISTDKPVYFRGININNTSWADSFQDANYGIRFKANNLVALSGKISSLVDYTSNTKLDLPRLMEPFIGNQNVHSISHLILDCDVVRSTSGRVGQNCYRGWFANCTNLIDTPIYDLSPYRYSDYTNYDESAYANMFYGCTRLKYVTSYPPYYSSFCYDSMFMNCTSLKTIPALPVIETARGGSFKEMFAGCINLETLPKLTATTILAANGFTSTQDAYYHMFYNCKKIMLSTTQNVMYNTPYRIPVTGEAQAQTAVGTYASMFSGTGGTFKSPIELNTTYYTANMVV